jgi:hypothetical protein
MANSSPGELGKGGLKVKVKERKCRAVNSERKERFEQMQEKIKARHREKKVDLR